VKILPADFLQKAAKEAKLQRTLRLQITNQKTFASFAIFCWIHSSLRASAQYWPPCWVLVLVAVPRPVAPPAPGVVMPVGTALGLVCGVPHPAKAKPTTTTPMNNWNNFMRPNLYDDSDK
jgi:hypothetical protein